MPPVKISSSDGFYARELKLRAEAGAVQKRLQAQGVDWQDAWRTHPVAIAYRQLLKEAWEGDGLAGDRAEPPTEDDQG